MFPFDVPYYLFVHIYEVHAFKLVDVLKSLNSLYVNYLLLIY